jgi:hypothetical protein
LVLLITSTVLESSGYVVELFLATITTPSDAFIIGRASITTPIGGVSKIM